MSLPAVAILAGGLATRLGELTARTPKSLLTVAGHPFVHHQLRLLKRQGVEDVVFCVGHYGEQIRDFVGDGSAYGLRVRYAFDGPKLLGTGGALKAALPLLGAEFFVIYGDSYLDLPLERVHAAFVAAGQPALMTVFHNEGRFDASNVRFEDGRIRVYDKKSTDPALKHIDYGLGLIRASALAAVEADAFDLAAFYGKLVAEGELAGFEVTQRFYEIGSAQGLIDTDAYISRG